MCPQDREPAGRSQTDSHDKAKGGLVPPIIPGADRLQAKRPVSLANGQQSAQRYSIAALPPVARARLAGCVNRLSTTHRSRSRASSLCRPAGVVSVLPFPPGSDCAVTITDYGIRFIHARQHSIADANRELYKDLSLSAYLDVRTLTDTKTDTVRSGMSAH